MAFESDPVDLIVLDEEPDDPRIISSCKARFSTTNGVLVLPFTPLLGMSFTYDDYYAPTVRPENEIADRVWQLGDTITVIEMGMADNPASIKGGGVRRMLADPSMTDAEKNARLYGKYGYTEGLLFPTWAMLGMPGGPEIYQLDALPANRLYRWVLTADPNKRHGALLTALDEEGNRYYASEHYRESLPDSKHAQAYKDHMLTPWGLRPEDVQVWADPGGAGAQAIINLAEHGIMAAPIRKDAGSVAASIKRLRGAAYVDPDHRHPQTRLLGAPRVYFIRWNEHTKRGLRSEWGHGKTEYRESRLMWELRKYRQEEESAPDTPVKVLDDVTDCARYFELARAMEPRIGSEDEREKARAHLDSISRAEQQSFDAMADKAEAAHRKLLATAGARLRHDREGVIGR
jgi:phage terminase large subunit-like protein